MSKLVNLIGLKNSKSVLGFSILISCMVHMNTSLAATRYAVTVGNWNGSIWASTSGGFPGSAGTPTSSDDVFINNNMVVSITGNASAKSVTVGVTGTGGAILQFNNSSNVTLTVVNDVNVNDGMFIVANSSGSRNHTLNIGGNLSVTSGNIFKMVSNDATDAANVTFNKNGSATVSGTGIVTFNEITLDMGSSSSNILDVQSIITMANGGLNLTDGTFKVSSASTIVPFTSDIASSPYLIPSTCGLWCNGATFNSTVSCDWTVRGYLRISSGTVNLGVATDDRFRTESGTLIVEGGTFNVAGRITYTSSSPSPLFFSMSGGTINLPTVGSASTGVAPFDMSVASGSFTMSGGTIVIRRAGGGGTPVFGFQCYASTYNVTGGTLQIGDALTPVNQTIQVETTVPLYNLTVNSNNAKAQFKNTANIIIKNNVTISSGQLDANTISCSVGNDWTNNSSATAFIPSTAMVTFNGVVGQDVGGNFPTSFNNLTINNTTPALSSATVTLGNDVNVSGALTLTRGYMVTTAANILNMLNSSTTSGTSTNSYVNGPMTKSGTSAFIFPTGYGNGTKWARIAIAAPSSSSTFTAQYFAYPYSNTTTMASTPTPVLNDVSTKEYWQLDRSLGSGDANVTLYWENAGWSGINQCSTTDLRVARWSGSAWQNNNNVVTTTGTCSGLTSGTVRTTAVVTAFGPLTFGSLSNGVNPLPVEWISFNGNYKNNKVELKWITATEINNNYFEVLRSTNGLNFEKLITVKGKGNSNVITNYASYDTHPLQGINYYRLRQVDYDGKSSQSEIISVVAPGKSATVTNIYPDASNQVLSVSMVSNRNTNVKIGIHDLAGRVLIEQEYELNNSDRTVELATNNLSQGIYLTKIADETGNILAEKKIIILKK